MRTKSHEKFWRKGSVSVSRDCPNFLGTPIISGTGKATDFKFGQYIQKSEGPSKQKPINNFGEKEAWAYPGSAQIFGLPPITSGTGKTTDFKFGQYIQNNRTKAH